MRVPRELLLIVVVLMAIAVATQAAAPEQSAPAPPDLASDSTAPGGARALSLWLESLGYRVERLEYRTFQPDDGTGALFVLAPSTQPDAVELATLRRWVERGGTLVLAGGAPAFSMPSLMTGGAGMADNALPTFLRTFGMELRSLEETTAETAPGQPLLLRPAVGDVRVEASSYISGTAPLVPYLGEPERPIAAGLAVGKGHVYVLASAYPLSNEGIGQADNAALLLNWLPAPREAGVVAFDEVHHGRADERSLGYLMVHEPWGWGVLYALGIGFLYLALSGRRLGRSVPTIADTRRAAAEYVVSVANLLRRGGNGRWVARHYEKVLRRQLADAVGAAREPVLLDTPALAARLSEMGRLAGGVEGREASRVLLGLHDGGDKGISEGTLVRLAAEADRIIKACGGRRL